MTDRNNKLALSFVGGTQILTDLSRKSKINTQPPPLLSNNKHGATTRTNGTSCFYKTVPMSIHTAAKHAIDAPREPNLRQNTEDGGENQNLSTSACCHDPD